MGPKIESSFHCGRVVSSYTSWICHTTIRRIRRLFRSKLSDNWHQLCSSCCLYRFFSWQQVYYYINRQQLTNYNSLFFYVIYITVSAIDCFKCVSVNGENPACEDPFHNNFTSDLLESPCLGGRKGRNGLFPATACLKLAGRYGTIIIINYTHHQITAAGLWLPGPVRAHKILFIFYFYGQASLTI